MAFIIIIIIVIVVVVAVDDVYLFIYLFIISQSAPLVRFTSSDHFQFAELRTLSDQKH